MQSKGQQGKYALLMFQKMEAILRELTEYFNEERYTDLVLVALNEARGTMQNRIFNSSEGAKDIEGRPMENNDKSGGAYSLTWGKTRTSKGRQIKHKDFSFTGSLIHSIKVEREGDKYKITMSDSAKANLIEKQNKKEIFSLSDEEVELFNDTFKTLLLEDLQKILAKYK